MRNCKKKGASITEHEVLEQLIERDRRDSGRELAPLKRADDAIVIDSTKLSIDAGGRGDESEDSMLESTPART